MLLVVIVAVQQAGIDGPLDHVVTVVEQEAAKLDVGTLFGLGDHGQIEEDDESHEASCLQSHASAFQPMRLQADQGWKFEFAVAFLEEPGKALDRVFDSG